MADITLRLGEDTPGRRQRRQAETRERLFRAALKLFSQRGFIAVTVQQITEAADVGKGTFFNYFPSKEHTLAALGQLQVSRIAAALAAVESGAQTAGQALRGLPHQLAEEPGKSPELARSLIVAVHSSAAVRKLMLANLERGRELLGQLIWVSQETGEIRKDRLALELARQYQQSFFGALFMWAVDPSLDLQSAIHAGFETYWNGARRGAEKKL